MLNLRGEIVNYILLGLILVCMIELCWFDLVIDMKKDDEKIYFQEVRNLFNEIQQSEWKIEEQNECKNRQIIDRENNSKKKMEKNVNNNDETANLQSSHFEEKLSNQIDEIRKLIDDERKLQHEVSDSINNQIIDISRKVNQYFPNNSYLDFNRSSHFVSIIAPSFSSSAKYFQSLFCTYMTSFLREKIGILNFEILITYQNDLLPFNRGYAINVASKFANPKSDYFIFHDISFFPISGDYSYSSNPMLMTTHLCNDRTFRACDITNNSDNKYLSVLKISRSDFNRTNGMSNLFFGPEFVGNFEYLCRLSQENISIAQDLNAYQWNVGGPQKYQVGAKPDMKNVKANSIFKKKICENSNFKFNDGLNIVEEDLKLNQSKNVYFNEIQTIGDNDSQFCKLITFTQNHCRQEFDCI